MNLHTDNSPTWPAEASSLICSPAKGHAGLEGVNAIS